MSLHFKSYIIALALVLTTTSAEFAASSPEEVPLPGEHNELKAVNPPEQLIAVEENNDSEVFEGVIEEDNVFDLEEEPVLQGRLSRFKTFIKGERAQNAIMAGMWSIHFSGKDYREVHNLGGIQYKGIFAGTFTNSHSRQVVVIAAARDLYRKRFGKHMLIDFGYKLGPMYGYKEGAPDIGGFTILPLACIGISYRDVGATINLFPSSAISFNTFIYTDTIWGKIKTKFKKAD